MANSLSPLLSLPAELRCDIWELALIADLQHQQERYHTNNPRAALIIDPYAPMDPPTYQWLWWARGRIDERPQYPFPPLFTPKAPAFLAVSRQVHREAETILFDYILRFERLDFPAHEDFLSLSEFSSKPKLEYMFFEHNGMRRRLFSIHGVPIEHFHFSRHQQEHQETARWDAFLYRDRCPSRTVGNIHFPEQTGILPVTWVIRDLAAAEEKERKGVEIQTRCADGDRSVMGYKF